MNAKLIGCILMGVFVAHVAVIMMMMRYRAMLQPPPPPTPVPLRVAEEIVVDPVTGEKTVNREYTVTTRLRPELYQGKDDEPVRK